MTNRKINTKENTPETGELNGIFNQPKKEQIPSFNAAANEKVIANGNSWIVLGRDRPVGFSSGYGGSGDSRSSAIDLCVGRQGTNPNSEEFVENNFGTLSYNKKAGDAARLYISQRADIDEYFGLSAGSQGMSKAKAAIGMMADDIRLVARRGVKIVTGGPKQVDSLGNDTNSMLGIDLIAGNIDTTDIEGRKYLQPMVKGDNLLEALNAIVDEIFNLNGIMTNYILQQQTINSILINGPYIGVSATGPIVSTLNPGSLAVATTFNTTRITSEAQVPLSTQKNIVLNSIKIDYLLSSGATYICSRYNRTN